MMTKIYKYTLPMYPGIHPMLLPEKLDTVLSVGVDPGDEYNLAIWARVDHSYVKVRQIHVVYTGDEDPGHTYIGTVIGPQKLVYHLFIE
jgi:hypothetical protein